MSLLQTLQGATQSFLAGAASVLAPFQKGTSDPVLDAFRQAFLTGQELTVHNLTRAMERHPFVYTAVDKIVTNLAAVELELFRGDSTSPVTSDPILDLLEHPNEVMTGLELNEVTFQWLELWGNAFWLKNRPARRGPEEAPIPTELLPLNPQNMRPLPLGSSSRLTGWQFNMAGEILDLSLDQVCWFRFSNPYDPRWGLSPLRALAVEVLGDTRAARWNAAFFKNSAVPEGVITIPRETGMVPDTEIDHMRERWYQHHREGAIEKGPAVLTRGATYASTARTHKEAEFLKGREFSREVIYGAFGVPPGVAGVMRFANYANLAVQKRQFWSDTLIPKLKRHEVSLTFQMYGPHSLDRLAYNMDGAASMAEDFDQKVETGARMFAMGYPLARINERLRMRLNVTDLKSADVPFLSVALAPAEDMANPPDPEPAPADDPPPEDEPEDEGAKAMRRAWKALSKGPSSAPPVPLERQVDPNEFLAAELFDLEERNKALVKLMDPSIRAAVDVGGLAVFQEGSLEGIFLSTDPAVLQYFATKEVLVREINDRVRSALIETVRATVTQGLEERLGPSEIATNIKTSLSDTMTITRSRSLTIARTEAGGAYNVGRFEGMKQGGAQFHEWLKADGEARDSHLRADHDIVVIGERFQATGLLYPQEPSGPAKEVINCRCVSVPSKGPDQRSSITWKVAHRPVRTITNGLERKLRNYFSSMKVEVLANFDAFLAAIGE